MLTGLAYIDFIYLLHIGNIDDRIPFFTYAATFVNNPYDLPNILFYILVPNSSFAILLWVRGNFIEGLASGLVNRPRPSTSVTVMLLKALLRKPFITSFTRLLLTNAFTSFIVVPFTFFNLFNTSSG